MKKEYGRPEKAFEVKNGRKGKEINRVSLERYKLCPNCGNFYSHEEDVEYCGVCGSKLIDRCPQCHEPIIYPTAKFCPLCGAKYGKSDI